MIQISSAFDSGAIEVLRCKQADDIRLLLRADNAADFRQWFHFRLVGGGGKALRLVFENAADAAYPDGWPDYRCVASYDREHWFRIANTRYENGQLVVEHTPAQDCVYYAYFEPYSHERHLDLLSRAAVSPFARLQRLGSTVDGRDVDVLRVGAVEPGQTDPALPQLWIIARQHPGETMAEWFIEGLLQRLLDPADAVARQIRAQAQLNIVPNMNPDGAVRGNLRTNAAGRNLNREWRTPDAAASPEVFAVRAAMEASGCALFLDIHGDEALPYVFFAAADEVPGYRERAGALQAAFIAAFAAACPDFQSSEGYAPGRFGDEMLSLASNWVAHRFGCVSLTLEMPFKDDALRPDAAQGWSSARSKRLGAATLDAMLRHVGALARR